MTVDAAPTERSPLLPGAKTNGTVNNAGTEGDAEQGSSGGVPEAVILSDEPSTAKLVTVMGSIWIGTFLAALDSTMVATLATPISSSFNSFSLISWLASSYFIANAALQPLSGKLTDIYGRRAGLVWSNVVFIAGNLACGFAQEEWQIIAGRIVAGIGGGGLTAISTFVASDLVPLRRRGVWQGFGNITFGLGAAVGGVVGGAIHDAIGWRWAFFAQVPFSAFSCIVVWYVVRIPVRETHRSRIRRIDFAGALTLVATLVLLLLGLNSGGNTVPWTHPLVLTTLPGSALLFAAFLHIEANVASEPIIPVRIMADRTVLAACFTNWFMTMTQFSILFYAPVYFQLRGASPTEAGARLAPSSIGVMIGSVGTGLIMRSIGRYYALNAVIESILCVAAGSWLAYDLTTPRWPEFITMAAGGLGYAGMLTVMLLALISAVEHKYQAVITSASYAFRSTGSTIGITISSAVFQNVLQRQLWARLAGRSDAGDIIRQVRDSLDAIQRIAPELQPTVREAYMLALRGVFGTVLGLSVLGLLISFLIREHKLHSSLSRDD